MKINRIAISGFMGVRSMELKPTQPVILITGPNGAGKSSTLEAARAALTGAVDRVALKKHYGQLVSEGEKIGTVLVESDAGRCAFTLPGGKHKSDFTPHPALPFVLEPHRLSNLDESARRAFLFGLLGISTDPDAIAARLVNEFGCDAALTAEVAPYLNTGFPAAEKKAREQASEARGAWRAATGEAYGAQKAEGWKAPDAPEVDPESMGQANADLQAAEAAFATAQQTLGAVQEQAKQYEAAQGRMEALREHAGKLGRIRDKLARDEAELKLWKDKLDALPPAPGAGSARPAMACPDCGSVLEVRNGELHHHEPGKAEDAETVSRRKQWSDAIALYTKSVQSGQRDLLNAERAKVELADLEALKPVDAGSVTAAREAAKQAGEAVAAVREALRKLVEQQAIHNVAATRTEQARQHHHAVVAWTKLAEALSPDGLPARIVADALNPLNAKLAEFALIAEWPVVHVGGDMSITFGGRLLSLCSESERWRTDALLAGAVAHFSGVRFLMLDRFDVLDAQGREDLLFWLSEMAANSVIDQAIIAGTLKERPAKLFDNCDAVWIEKAGAQTAKEAA